MLIKSKKAKSPGFDSPSIPSVEARTLQSSRTKLTKTLSPAKRAEELQRQYSRLQGKMETVKEASYNMGLKDGEKAGFGKGVSEIRSHVEELKNLIESIRRNQAEIIGSAEEFVVSFALKVAEKILGSPSLAALTLDKSRIEEIVGESLKHFPDSVKYMVKVHKETAKVLHQAEYEISAHLETDAEISFIEDSALKMSDCLVETDYGILDARIDSQLDEITRVLLDTSKSSEND